MSSKLVVALQRALAGAGWIALRFNFRGVGRSGGSYGGGIDEVADVAGALATVRGAHPGTTAVIGWSFGALVALNAVARDPDVQSFVGVAPPAHAAFAGRFELPPIADLDGWKARALLVGGTEDPFCKPRDLERLAELVPDAGVRIVEGADHFFTDHTEALCELAVSFVDAEA